MTKKFSTAGQALDFIRGGNATVTLKSASGSHYTYKVEAVKDRDDRFFVKVLNGPDNESSYEYLGMIFPSGFSATAATGSRVNRQSFKAFDWAYRWLTFGQIPSTLEVYHEGRCGRCGRKLTHPESIMSGFGPECSGRRAIKSSTAIHGELF